MMRRITEDRSLRYGDGGAELKGGALSRFLVQLSEFYTHFDKADRKLRLEAATQLVIDSGPERKSDFETADKLRALAAGIASLPQVSTANVVLDEEHNLWELRYRDRNQLEHVVNAELTLLPEFKQAMKLGKAIAEHNHAPFLLTRAPTTIPPPAPSTGNWQLPTGHWPLCP